MNRWSLCWGQHLHDQWRAVAASAHHDEPAFAQARVNVAFPRMLGAAQSMLERLDAVEEGQPYDIEIEMTHVTADIIFRTIFSKPMQGRMRIASSRHLPAISHWRPSSCCLRCSEARWLTMPWYRWQSNQAARRFVACCTP